MHDTAIGRDSRAAEIKLILAVACGNEEAFTSLFTKYRRWVFTVCAHMLGDPGAAEDAAQDIWIKIWNAAPTFIPQDSSFRTWLGTVTKNHCTDLLRKRKNRDTVSLDETWEDGTPRYEIPSQGHRHLENRLLNKEIVPKLFEYMTTEEKFIFSMIFVQEYSYDEFQAVFPHMPMGTVKSRINRLRTRLPLILSSIATS